MTQTALRGFRATTASCFNRSSGVHTGALAVPRGPHGRALRRSPRRAPEDGAPEEARRIREAREPHGPGPAAPLQRPAGRRTPALARPSSRRAGTTELTKRCLQPLHFEVICFIASQSSDQRKISQTSPNDGRPEDPSPFRHGVRRARLHPGRSLAGALDAGTTPGSGSREGPRRP